MPNPTREPVRHLDIFDLEAAAEGNARSRMFHNGATSKPMGRRLIQQAARHSSAKTVTSRFLVTESEKMR